MRSSDDAKLDFLVGEWTSSDTIYPGPGHAGGTSAGQASYRWEVGGTWLIYDFRTDLPGLGPYEVRGGVAYDSSAGKYQAYTVNNLGALLLYDGVWEGDETLVFTLLYPKREADTRVTYIKGADGAVRMTSEHPGRGRGPRTVLRDAPLEALNWRHGRQPRALRSSTSIRMMAQGGDS
jgi:hypothetical protein